MCLHIIVCYRVTHHTVQNSSDNPLECPVDIHHCEYVGLLANISRSRYIAIATQPVHRLQIRPLVHN